MDTLIKGLRKYSDTEEELPKYLQALSENGNAETLLVTLEEGLWNAPLNALYFWEVNDSRSEPHLTYLGEDSVFVLRLNSLKMDVPMVLTKASQVRKIVRQIKRR